MVASLSDQTPRSTPRLREVAGFFLKLGTIAFGGPAAHVAMMEDELVRRRKWIARDEFLDLFAVANILPGPSSTELAIFIGYRLRGLAGLLLAGTCFILPAFLMVGVIVWAYVRYGNLPAVMGILAGVQPVVIAIVLQSLWRLSNSAIKTRTLAVLCFAAVVASFLRIDPIFVLFGTGALALSIRSLERRHSAIPLLVPPMAIAATTTAPSVWGILLAFAKIGCVVFGSGYVLLAFLRRDLVVSREWLSDKQLLDAVAIGQVTPGPVFTTATFIGYLLCGPWGAIAATVGIFAPAFLFVAMTGPLISRLRKSKALAALLDGLNVGALGLMAYVTWQLAKSALMVDHHIDWMMVILAIISAFILFRFGLNATWLVLMGAAVGAIRSI